MPPICDHSHDSLPKSTTIGVGLRTSAIISVTGYRLGYTSSSDIGITTCNYPVLGSRLNRAKFAFDLSRWIILYGHPNLGVSLNVVKCGDR